MFGVLKHWSETKPGEISEEKHTVIALHVGSAAVQLCPNTTEEQTHEMSRNKDKINQFDFDTPPVS